MELATVVARLAQAEAIFESGRITQGIAAVKQLRADAEKAAAQNVSPNDSGKKFNPADYPCPLCSAAPTSFTVSSRGLHFICVRHGGYPA